MKERIVEKLKEIKDPEIGIDIWTLGLVYEIKADERSARIVMTLTTAFCPFAKTLVETVEKSVKSLYSEGAEVSVDLTFDPPWKPTDELRAALGL